MALVGRANKFLTVNDSLVQHYLDKGYTLYDEDGKILQEPVIKDMATLSEAYKRSQENVKKLEKIIQDLTAENESLVAQLEEVTKRDNPDEDKAPAAKAPKKKGAESKNDSTTE